MTVSQSDYRAFQRDLEVRSHDGKNVEEERPTHLDHDPEEGAAAGYADYEQRGLDLRRLLATVGHRCREPATIASVPQLHGVNFRVHQLTEPDEQR